jgi:starch synthase
MDVLMVTPEVGPYARETRLGDVVAGLSKTLVQNGHQVTIAAPRYPAFEDKGLLVARRLTPLSLDDGTAVTVFDGQLATGVKVVLFDANELFAAGGIYGDGAETNGALAERFGLLCRAARALAMQRRERNEPFDVLHAFDWPAAPAALLAGRKAPQGLPAVLTVTAPAERGVFGTDRRSALGLSQGTNGGGGSLDFLGLGTAAADVVVLSSAAHARDVLAGVGPAQSSVLAACGERLTGVPDGIDYSVFNPATDASLKSRFDAEDVANKGTCKTDVVRTHGLELEVARPLIVALVPAAGDGKRLASILEDLARVEVTLVIAGAGASSLSAVDLGPRGTVLPELDGTLLRRLLAGADIAFLPQPYATHAFEIRVAERYGAIPVCVSAGATEDAVVDCDAALQTGTGFLAADATPAALVAALQRALAAYASERWPVLRRRVMRLDLGWDRPARRYVQLYRQAMAARTD